MESVGDGCTSQPPDPCPFSSVSGLISFKSTPIGAQAKPLAPNPSSQDWNPPTPKPNTSTNLYFPKKQGGNFVHGAAAPAYEAFQIDTAPVLPSQEAPFDRGTPFGQLFGWPTGAFSRGKKNGPRKGKVFAYVGSIQNLEDLKDSPHPIPPHRVDI